MEADKKVLHDEEIEGGKEIKTTLRIVQHVEGEEETRVYDFEGQGVCGMIVEGEDGTKTAFQGFVVGMTNHELMLALDSMIDMITDNMEKNHPLATMGLSAFLAMKAAKIAQI